MPNLKQLNQVNVKLEPVWVQALDRYCQATGVTKRAAMRTAIRHLAQAVDPPDDEDVRERLAAQLEEAMTHLDAEQIREAGIVINEVPDYELRVFAWYCANFAAAQRHLIRGFARDRAVAAVGLN